MKIKSILLISVLLTAFSSFAQDAIKNVIVETYYVSDATDATDTTGGYLEAGSKTYRVFVQLKPGCRLLSVFGDKDHTLRISSTSDFFNNKEYGESFGKDIRFNDLKKNTVALDTWLTLGQASRKAAQTYFGVPKDKDTDGSLIGGINNDGGSAEILAGLLTNADPHAGTALTTADGLVTGSDIPSNWVTTGIIDEVSGMDSTIFGPVVPGKEFISNNASITNSGVSGADPESNYVLIAQLTTKGELTFELNLQVYDPSVASGYRSFYVANGTDSTYFDEQKIVTVSSLLRYPAECGCQDANYLEYDRRSVCSAENACKTRIVMGCMDPSACNYDPSANYNIPGICCYPGSCHDRDLSLACPEDEPLLHLDVYPNPATSRVTIQASKVINKETRYLVYNYNGNIVFEKQLGLVNGQIEDNLDLSGFKPGLYLVRLFSGNASDSQMFIRN